MKDFEKTHGIVRKWNNLVMLWPIAKDDAERKKILQGICEFEEFAERIISNELLEICDDLPNLSLYFDVWLNILCKLDTTFSYPNAFPKQWEEFEKLPDEWQELWCNAIDRAGGLYIDISFAIKGFIDTYNMTPKREIPKALRTAFEAAGETITDDVVQYTTDGNLSRDIPQKASNLDFKKLMIDDEDGEKLGKLHSLVKGKKGKAVALIITAAMSKRWLMLRPSFAQMEREFGEGKIGAKSGYNKYMDLGFNDDEIQKMKNAL